MTPRLLAQLAVDPTLEWLASFTPVKPTAAARAMLVAFACQETELKARVQLIARDGRLQPTGPARSFWQLERIAVTELLRNPRTQGWVREVAERLRFQPTVDELHTHIAWNDQLGCALARLNLWLDPHPLPPAVLHAQGEAWQTYLRSWRPGKPHGERWPWSWASAMEVA